MLTKQTFYYIILTRIYLGGNYMIKSYEQLVDKALELEELLIQRRIVHDKILEL